MRSASSRQIIKLLLIQGWMEKTVRCSHCQFKNATIPGRVAVPHPKKELAMADREVNIETGWPGGK